ncbi:hypothetical protein [Nocardia sp. NPDC055049]
MGSKQESLILADIEFNIEESASALRRFLPGDGRVLIFWGSLTLPTVAIGTDFILSHFDEIFDRDPEFWIYSASNSVLVENSFAGHLRIARIPTGGSGGESFVSK